MKTVISIDSIISRVCTRDQKSAWSRGVTLYALDILNEIIEDSGSRYFPVKDGKVDNTHCYTATLIGKHYDFWHMYSWGGGSLVYNYDIAERLCTPSEFRKAEKNDFFRANKREEWLDVQARALYQASNMIVEAIKSELAA